MSYIDNTLLVQEHVLYRALPHWIIFLTSIMWLVLASIASTILSGGLVILALLPLFMAFYEGIKAFIEYKTSEYAVTNKRVLIKIGFIKRYSLEIFLQKVEGIQVHQSVLGRLLNYGTLVVSGTGGSRDYFSRVADPLEFRRRVQEQIEVILGNIPDVVNDVNTAPFNKREPHL